MNSYDNNRPHSMTEFIAAAETTRLNLETAKLAHKKMVESVDLRTLSIAQMAMELLTSNLFQDNAKAAIKQGQKVGAPEAVRLATEIMVEAELSAAKEKVLQEQLKQ